MCVSILGAIMYFYAWLAEVGGNKRIAFDHFREKNFLGGVFRGKRSRKEN